MTERYRKTAYKTFEVNLLESSDKDLEEISVERSLGLSLDEMKKLRNRFKRREKRNPTDVELEAFAQSWSEHCCYKTSKPILKDTVFKVKSPEVMLAISEDAAVVEFDTDHAYVIKIESHNHPSALDPYGGAATGIGGILRDVACMGAQPIALIDPLFFGPLDHPEKKLPSGTKHPRFLFKGVVQGIADYGNRVGIPTVAGSTFFHESYVGNCLVNVGCIGIADKKEVIRSRVGNSGDLYIMAGGKTGRDGIHGVTFASAELTEESEEESMPAVQLGYAIMKEPLIHACLEANRKGLLTGLKDFGGGGLSCVASEMAHAAGKGATVHLDKVPLKEPGLSPWEIWVSESQERMMLSVKPKNLKKVLGIFKFWDVPATVVGKIDNTKRIKAKYKGKTVLDLDLRFLTSGVQYCRPYRKPKRKRTEARFALPKNFERIMYKIIGSYNIASKESVIRRYDHEVRANTILKPMQGVINHQTHGDAAVLKPLPDSFRGLALSTDVNPILCKYDPYWGAASAVEECVRNLVAVNSRPHTMVDCLNFANPEKPDRLGEFVASCEGMYYAANSFGTPFVSGNVSLYNESMEGPVNPTPTVLGFGIVADVRETVSSDMKDSGNLLYLVGSTKQELGGSVYYQALNLQEKGLAPRVRPKETIADMNSLLDSMDSGLVASCHDLSDGGLFVSASEMAFGGDLGLELDLSAVGGSLRPDIKLLSESNGRWLVEAKPVDQKEFEKKLPKAKMIGTATKEKKISVKDGKFKLDLDLDKLYRGWMNGIEREA